MLVLTRKVGNRIIIDDGRITIQVVQIKGRQVRLGIEAPRDTKVHREEVHQSLQKGLSASSLKPSPPAAHVNNIDASP